MSASIGGRGVTETEKPQGTVTFRVWRGDRSGGEFREYPTEVSEGMVVLASPLLSAHRKALIAQLELANARLADLTDPDVLAGFQPRRIGEVGVIRVARREAELPEHHHQARRH